MKKNRRPGYLAGFQGLVSRAARVQQRPRIRTGLGAFGKGAFVPMPNAPAGGVLIEDAVHAGTGQPYMQDPRCPEGEKMVQKMEPCVGQDCCDGGDCDPEGTPYPEEECEDDPDYQQKPQAAPAPAPEQAAPQQQSSSSSAPAAEDAPEAVGPTAAQQAELMALSAEAAQADSIVTSAPALAPPSAYTGSPPPSYVPTRTAPKTPNDQQVLMELVAQHRESQPAARPRPVVRAPMRSPAPAPQPAIPDLLGWLRGALFGSGNGMDGWSDSKASKYGVPLVAIAILIFAVSRFRK